MTKYRQSEIRSSLYEAGLGTGQAAPARDLTAGAKEAVRYI